MYYLKAFLIGAIAVGLFCAGVIGVFQLLGPEAFVGSVTGICVGALVMWVGTAILNVIQDIRHDR